MAIGRRVVHQLLESLLCEGGMSMGAGRGRRMPLVLGEAVAVRMDMDGLVSSWLGIVSLHGS